jgi:PAS domain-containing protein
MSSFADLLSKLPAPGSPQRVVQILEWVTSAFRLEGVAVFTADPVEAGVLVTRAALGALRATAPLLAAELARTGIPVEQVPLPLAEGLPAAFVCRPLDVQRGVPGGALVLQGRGAAEAARRREGDLALAAAALQEALRAEKSASAGGRVGGSSPADFMPRLSPLADGLRLPLYACDLQGRFTYASPAFLSLCGFPSLEALGDGPELFPEPKERADELETLKRQGKVDSVPLVIRSGSDARLSIRDSAVLHGDSIFGIFFDVTALLAANAELKDALQVQELLNDTIMAGTRQLQRTQGAAIRSLARLAEYRDQTTGFHLQRICEFSRLIAVEVHRRAPYPFRISMEYADDISISSMLHDVGKVSTPDQILLKPGKLDPDEWEIMKKHTVFGWEVLHKADRELGEQSFLTLAASIALSHHEKYDGTGYPNGAAGEQIPLSARICAVADVYDALTSSRPYKPAWSHEDSLRLILEQSGRHFDPVLVEIFRDLGGQLADVHRRFPG